MNKKELEKLRTLNATKSMIDALKMPGEKKDWSKKVHEYKYWVAARCQQLDGILKVSICTREDIEKDILKPKWDISSIMREKAIPQERDRKTERISGVKQ